MIGYPAPLAKGGRISNHDRGAGIEEMDLRPKDFGRTSVLSLQVRLSTSWTLVRTKDNSGASTNAPLFRRST